VLRYYGDQGYNFVPPKEIDPSPGFGYDTDFVNAEVLLSRVRVQDGKLTLPDGMSYEVLVLPDREDISLPVLHRIEQLVREGATIAGPRPSRATGLTNYPKSDRAVAELATKMWRTCGSNGVRQVEYGKGYVFCGGSLREILRQRKVGLDLSLAGEQKETDVDFIHRRTPEADIYFVRNTTQNWRDIDAVFRVSGRQPELWDPAAGTRTRPEAAESKEGGHRVRFRLEPEGSVFVVFRNPGPGSPDEPWRRAAIDAGPVPATAREVAGPWNVTFGQGPAAPPAATWPNLRSWTEGPEEHLRYFSGIGQYSTELNLPKELAAAGRRVLLDLGDLWAVGELIVNDRDLGVVWKKPFRVDITDAIRPGANRLTVRVANNWVNRLVGDSRSNTRTTKTNVVRTGTNAGMAWSEVPLHRSGLLGPVRVFTAP
jgi:hypothetical protein